MIELRVATPDDAAAMAATHIGAWQSAYRGAVPDSFLDALDPERRADRFRQFLTSGTGETYVVVRQACVIGHVTIGPCRDEDLDSVVVGEIWGIYLRPQFWRLGIGAEVCRRVEGMLAGRGFLRIVLWTFEANESARRFYEAMGYALDGATQIISAGASVPAVRYRKKIDIHSTKENV